MAIVWYLSTDRAGFNIEVSFRKYVRYIHGINCCWSKDPWKFGCSDAWTPVAVLFTKYFGKIVARKYFDRQTSCSMTVTLKKLKECFTTFLEPKRDMVFKPVLQNLEPYFHCSSFRQSFEIFGRQIPMFFENWSHCSNLNYQTGSLWKHRKISPSIIYSIMKVDSENAKMCSSGVPKRLAYLCFMKYSIVVYIVMIWLWEHSVGRKWKYQ